MFERHGSQGWMWKGTKIAGLPRHAHAGVWVLRAEAGHPGWKLRLRAFNMGRRPGHQGQGIDPAMPTPTSERALGIWSGKKRTGLYIPKLTLAED